MKSIRKATIQDASRIAEILVFTKRINYRSIFCNDKVSFGEIQVFPLAQEYITNPDKLKDIWVFDDEFVKGMISIEGHQIKELYVDSFFQRQGIGAKLIQFAIQEFDAQYLWVLEKNNQAIKFYQSHGFSMTQERMFVQGTTEFVAKMVR